jgi:hypothetical protein
MSFLTYATIGAVWLVVGWILWRDWFAPRLSDPPVVPMIPGDVWSRRAQSCRCQFYRTGLLHEQDGALWMRADGDETAITEALVALTMEEEE